jgi:resuscitation-promoting factor RpfB
MEEKRENKTLTISYARALGYNHNQIKCLVTLWTRESRFDHLADNPRSTAYGIAQLLRERSGQPELQILHGLRYLGHRYGKSACRALQHSNRRGWY